MSTALTHMTAAKLGLGGGMEFVRGSSGLFALFSALRTLHGAGEVIVPSLCCETVALAALTAGHEVRFADVDEQTLCVSPATVGPLMSPLTRAVLVVHLYGVDARAEAFNALRQAHPAALFIEDIAHAIGGKDRDGRQMGAALDVTLASFADSKIVPGDGGLLLYSRPPVGEDLVRAQLPAGAPRSPPAALSSSMRNLVHAVADLWRTGEGSAVPGVFPSFAPHYRELVVLDGEFGDAPAAMLGLSRLDAITATRHADYVEWRELFAAHSVRVPDMHAGSTCWRCPVVFDTPLQAAQATALLRAGGVHASNHYFPLSVLFGSPATPVAEHAALRMVNLWTDGSLNFAAKQKAVALLDPLKH